jgi:hypothetical protein
MNFGFKLAKPAESDLGIALRLWQSNNSSWCLDSRGISFRINHAIETVSDLPELSGVNDGGIDLVRRVTNRVNSWVPYADLSYINQHKARIRQCRECARIAYHSLYFVMPWISKCPVHKCWLTEVCPQCGEYWYKGSGTQPTNCETCSWIVGKSKLISRSAYRTEQYVSAFMQLDSLFKEAPRYKDYDRIHINFRWSVRSDSTSKLLTIPSTLASLARTAKKDMAEMSALGINFLDCYRFEFAFEDNEKAQNSLLTLNEIAKMTVERKKILSRAKTALADLREHPHPFRTCDRTSNGFHCLFCEMLKVVNNSQLDRAVS